MEAIWETISGFFSETGFALFFQDGNWRCLIMIALACFLLYLAIVKKFEPLLLVPIAFGMLLTNLPGANLFHEELIKYQLKFVRLLMKQQILGELK